MLNYKQIWHGIKPIHSWINLTLQSPPLAISWQNFKTDSRLKKYELGIVAKTYSHLILDLGSSWTIQTSLLKIISQNALIKFIVSGKLRMHMEQAQYDQASMNMIMKHNLTIQEQSI